MKMETKTEDLVKCRLRLAKEISKGWMFEIVEDTIFNDANLQNVKASTLAKTDKVFYNFTKGTFGYGDDPRDWENDRENWVEVAEIHTQEDDPCLGDYLVILWGKNGN